MSKMCSYCSGLVPIFQFYPYLENRHKKKWLVPLRQSPWCKVAAVNPSKFWRNEVKWWKGTGKKQVCSWFFHLQISWDFNSILHKYKQGTYLKEEWQISTNIRWKQTYSFGLHNGCTTKFFALSPDPNPTMESSRNLWNLFLQSEIYWIEIFEKYLRIVTVVFNGFEDSMRFKLWQIK
jgi:hypothetical protein